MATKSRKTQARWDSEVERKLIDIWADILEELEKKGEGTAAAQFSLCNARASPTQANAT